jgi:hypothetical protein
MANKKKEDMETQTNKDVSKDLLEKLEKEAFERVCKAAGTTPAKIEAMEKAKAAAPAEEELVQYDIRPVVVHINGRAMPSHGVAPRSVVDGILFMAGSYRNRMLEEKLGKTSELVMLRDGVMQAKVVKVEDITGLEVHK